MSNGIQKARRTSCFFLWAIWFGGLTFYAAIVVPVGTDAIGATEQGFITQQVTVRLNVAATLLLAVWLWEFTSPPNQSVRAFVVWVLQLMTLLTLVLLHWKLSSILDLEGRSVPEQVNFYGWHRAYLLATTAQWFIGIIMGWELLHAPGRHTPRTDAA